MVNNKKQAKRTLSFNRKTASDRRQQLIAAGIACLGEGGMAAFTIDKICKQADVSRGLINHHFKSKHELLVSIYADMTEHLVQVHDADRGNPAIVGIIETSFDETSFNRSNLRAWLAIWGQVASDPALNELHRQRYDTYKAAIKSALRELSSASQSMDRIDGVARQLIALIDGLWLEYCLHSDGFSLASARKDCYQFLSVSGFNTSNTPTSNQEF